MSKLDLLLFPYLPEYIPTAYNECSTEVDSCKKEGIEILSAFMLPEVDKTTKHLTY